MVCLSGLDVLDVFFSGDSCKEVDDRAFCDGEGSGGPVGSASCPLSPLGVFCDEEVLECNGFRLSTSGLANCVYVTAGMVPPPIHPWSWLFGISVLRDSVDGSVVFVSDELTPF